MTVFASWDHIKEKVSGLEKVVIVVESPDSAANMRFVRDMSERLSHWPDVGLIEYERDMSFFEEHQLLYIEYEDLVDIYRRVSSRAQMDIFSEPLDFGDIRAKYGTPGGGPRGGDWATPDGTLRLMKFFPSGQSGNIGARQRPGPPDHGRSGLPPSGGVQPRHARLHRRRIQEPYRRIRRHSG